MAVTNKSDLEKLPRYSAGNEEGGDSFGMREDPGGEWLRRGEVLAFFGNLKPEPYRERLPDVRESVIHTFVIARPGHRNGDLTMDVTVGLYPDGRPGEIFIRSDYTGSFASGALDAVATALSMAWQYGVPFKPTVEKLKGMRFEPQGATGDPKYGIVTSPLDYVAKWLLDKFCGASNEVDLPRTKARGYLDRIPGDKPLDLMESLEAASQMAIQAASEQPVAASEQPVDVKRRRCLNCGLSDMSSAVCRRCGDRRWSEAGVSKEKS